MTFTDPLDPGTYEARVHLRNDDSVVSAKCSFTVNYPLNSHVSARGVYAPFESVTVSYSNLAGYDGDYITIVPANTPDDYYAEWYSTSGQKSGTMTFTNTLDQNIYEIRYHPDNDDSLILARARFNVFNPNCVLTSAQQSFNWEDPIVINYTGAAGYPADYITVVPSTSSDDNYWEFYKTDSATSGFMTFTNFVDPGTYEARYHVNDNDGVVSTRLKFTVAFPAVLINTDQSVYPQTPDSVLVKFSTAKAYPNDYICIARVYADDSDCDEWYYTGAANGTITFSNSLGAGTYEARFHPDDSDLVSGRVRFTVGPVPTEPITNLNYTGLMDFQSVDAGSSTQKTLVINNAGNAPLSVSAVNFSGLSASMFSVVSPSGISPANPWAIPPNYGGALNIRFSPTASGTQNATITILSNDPIASSITLNLTGFGTVPILNGANLIINPGAETVGQLDTCTGTTSNFNPWTTNSSGAVCRYGNDLSANSPGPPGLDRGGFYFAGAPGTLTGASFLQTVNLPAANGGVGGRTFTLSGWFGGLDESDSGAYAAINFFDSGSSVLGNLTTVPAVLSTERDGWPDDLSSGHRHGSRRRGVCGRRRHSDACGRQQHRWHRRQRFPQRLG